MYNMFGITMSDVQSHVDKKISQAHNLIISKFATKAHVARVDQDVRDLDAKLKKLEQYLNVGYSETCVKGYSKVKKKK